MRYAADEKTGDRGVDSVDEELARKFDEIFGNI